MKEKNIKIPFYPNPLIEAFRLLTNNNLLKYTKEERKKNVVKK